MCIFTWKKSECVYSLTCSFLCWHSCNDCANLHYSPLCNRCFLSFACEGKLRRSQVHSVCTAHKVVPPISSNYKIPFNWVFSLNKTTNHQYYFRVYFEIIDWKSTYWSVYCTILSLKYEFEMLPSSSLALLLAPVLKIGHNSVFLLFATSCHFLSFFHRFSFKIWDEVDRLA